MSVSPIASRSAALDWLEQLPGVSRETVGRLARFADLTASAAGTQNLVSASTLGDIFWVRHIVDCAQLLVHAPADGGRWADLGSGAGLPGLVIGIIAPQWRVTLVESRAMRCRHLAEMIKELGLSGHVELVSGRVETLTSGRFDVISARAFAPLPRLITTARHLAHATSLWLLPKGRNAGLELSTLPPAWQRCFALHPSLTDPHSGILVGTGRFG